jgi:CheY-like chemotaxis protein
MSPRKKILLVDDSPTVLMLERGMLEGRPYDVAVARDGQEAMERVEAEPPDLIVMDVMMPRLDGLQACRALRSREESRQIPVIIVTTLGEVMDREAAYASGCTDYVTKPIDGLEFLTKIENYLGED